MTLPADVHAALLELRDDPAAVPLSMPPPFYTDPAMLAAETDRVFLNGWVCVGREDETPEPGDYRTLEIFDEPLIVVRDRGGEVLVLSNVCRHRGSRLLEGTGRTTRFTCPYHRWSYGLDGALLAAPLVDASETFDRAGCRLPSFRTASWMGWTFVNLDGRAEDFPAPLGGLDAHVANYHAEEMRTAGTDVEAWPVNWKCLAENFMEGYHLTPVHRRTLHPMTPTRLCRKVPGGAGWTGYESHYSESFAGRRPFHPDMTEAERAQSMMVWIYPSFVAAVSPNSAVWMSIVPEGAEALCTRWGVVVREELDDDEARARFEFAQSFNAEDRARLLEVQKGLRSRFATRGHLAPPDYEGTVVDFYRYMAGRLTDGAEGARADAPAAPARAPTGAMA